MTTLPKDSSDVNPTSKPSKFVAVPMSVDFFVDGFPDIAELLQTTKKIYSGEVFISIRDYPDMFRTNIDRLRAQSVKGIHSVGAACLYHGFISVASHPAVKNLRLLKYRFDNAPEGLDGVVSSTLASYLRGFTVDLPGGKSKANIRVQQNDKSAVNNFALDIGMEIQDLSKLSIMESLYRQKSTNKDDSEQMRVVVTRFYDSASVRGRAANALMNEFQVPIVSPPEKWLNDWMGEDL